jgi:hypothetical protein
MKLTHAAIALVAAASLSACGGNRAGRTPELPGGGPSDVETAQAPRSPNIFERALGRDNRPNVGPCPLMGVLYETSRLVDFDAPDSERYANIRFTGEMQGVRGLCRYVDDDPILMNMEIDLAFGRGPAATSDRNTYRYWVAVARRGRGAPIEKQYFDVDVRFSGNEAVVTRTEQIERIVSPRANSDVSGENFEILVGFDLTPAQLQYNRDGKRFRIDAGS